MTQITKKVLPDVLTTLDVLKALAVVIMVCDHVGAYFFPDDMWWRAVGRVGFPIWFFLVGYAKGREISRPLLIGAILLVLGNIVVGMPIFPLNALATIIFLRLVVDKIMSKVAKNLEFLIFSSITFFVVIIYTSLLFEYGTLALLYCMFGYFVRNPDQVTLPKWVTPVFAIFCFFAFIYSTGQTFPMNFMQISVVTVGTGTVCWTLYGLEMLTYPTLSSKLPRLAVETIKFMGRKTLEIYVAHHLLFKAMALVVDPEHYVLFRWVWSPFSL